MNNSLPHDWQEVTLNDIIAPQKGALVSGPFGSNISKKYFVESGTPVIRGNNVTFGQEYFVDNGFVFITQEKAHELRNCEAVADDIIFTAAGSIGQVGIIPKVTRYPKYIISNKQLRLRCDTEIANPLYIYYWFSAPMMRHYIERQNTGASIPLLTLGILRSLPVSLPPLIVQKKIATLLCFYDQLIENNTRRIKILEEMAQLIYREWFVHFRIPGHKNGKMINSNLGMIPEGWAVTKLGDVIELAYGKGLRADKRKQGSVPVYGSGGIVGHNDEALVDGPGIIVGRKGNVGSVFWADTDFFPIDTVFYVQTDVSLYYVYFNLRHQSFINTDAAVPGLKREHAYRNDFLVPKKDVLKTFEEIASLLFKEIRNLNDQNANLRQTRDLLLPKLISGKIDVSDLDIDTGVAGE